MSGSDDVPTAIIQALFEVTLYFCQTILSISMIYEPRYEKTCLRDFRTGQTQTRLYSRKRWLVI